MSLPEPEPGLVIRFAYLWAEEYDQGRDEGSEDRPGVIVVASREEDGVTMVTVVPITRSPQGPDSVEIPANIKVKLGLDPGSRSWVVCSEYNEFEWPGPDLRPVSRTGGWTYGKLPNDLFLRITTTLRRVARARRLRVVARTS